VFPAHGGGTSFYIGNNPSARGVWNSIGGLLSGQVTSESDELAREFALEDVPEAERPAAIGRAMYGRAFEYMRERPGHYAWLQVRKIWLTLGNDEITQDYDLYGEREMLPFRSMRGVPFGVVLALGTLGFFVVGRHGSHEPRATAALPVWRAVLVAQLGATVASNVVFFTSSQHRLPMVVPLAFVAGPALVALARRGRAVLGRTPAADGPGPWPVGLAAVLLAQSFWPRLVTRAPTAVHYHNLAMAQDWVGEPKQALATLDRAVERRPDHAVIRLERAKLARRLHQYDKAERDLLHVQSLADVPPWIRTEAARELVLVRFDRAAMRTRGGAG
jgi:hypothetical protein